tara:strand:- start:163 stop:666 length:504 start_codon:yes stop_codon:yes gene_type:complete
MESEFVINPKTGRPVKVGNRTYRKLVNEGLVEVVKPNPKYDKKIVNQIDDMNDYTEEELETKIEYMNEEIPDNLQIVKGRGKYKNSFVTKHKQDMTRLKKIPKKLAKVTIPKTTLPKTKVNNLKLKLMKQSNETINDDVSSEEIIINTRKDSSTYEVDAPVSDDDYF